MSTFHPTPCPGGPHTYDENGNSECHILTLTNPCDSFASAGNGPEGDFEHSCFCRNCGWEFAEHIADDES